MSGPAPKDAGSRRRRNAPAGGEWADLPELDRPVLPALPRRPKKDPWSPRVRAMWNAWRRDPATGCFGPADIEYAIDTAYLAECQARQPTSSLAGELRLRMDGMGLTPKGRQNLRLRFAPPADVIPHLVAVEEPRPRRSRPRAVDAKEAR